MTFIIYSKQDCKYCDLAKKLCEDEGLPHEKREIPRDELKAKCGGALDAYPQIFVGDDDDDHRIGNFFEFQEYLENVYEPLLHPTLSRFTVFPIEHTNLWQLYKKAQMSNWTAEEVDLSKDAVDWEEKLTVNERRFIKYILAFFAGSDGIVFENINNNFADEVMSTEARSFYAYQCHNEMVHGETYSLLIDKYIKDPAEKREAFDAIQSIPCIAEKAKWALKWFDTARPFAERLYAFACVEGILFSGSFCAIFWLKKRGLMPGLTFSNELISRDEGLHQEFAVELFKMLRHPPKEDVLRELVREAVAIEKNFICEALPCRLIGMNSAEMSTYIEYVSDRLLKSVGATPLFHAKNPFDFMLNISLEGKTNFFEKRVGEYGKMDDSVAEEIGFDDDF